MKKHLILLTMVALVCACTDWTGSNDKKADLAWGKASLLIEKPIADGDSLCYHIAINLDTLSGESELAKAVAKVLRDSVVFVGNFPTVQQTMTAYAEQMETEWKTELAEMYSEEMEYKDALQYTYEIEGSPIDNGNDSILTYQTTTDCYLGGAHGSYVVFYYNFCLKTGKLLNIHDVIPADKQAQVLKDMEKQLCKDWDAKDLAELQEKTGITMLGDLYLTNNFLLKKDSILFLFNQYDIAPYAAGLISVTVKRP